MEQIEEQETSQAPREGISTAAGIIILALIAAAIGVGIWYFYIYQPNQESATTTPTQTKPVDETASWKTLTLEFSKGTLKYPSDWTVEKDTSWSSSSSNSSDLTTYPIIYSIKQNQETKESAGGVSEYDLTSWLTGPKEEVAYTMLNADRQKAVELLKQIYDDQKLTDQTKTELAKYSFEFFPYNSKTAIDWKYLESKDQKSRGFSCLNISGQDIGIAPQYTTTLYNPEKKVVVSIRYQIPQTAKEVKAANDKITAENFQQIQAEFKNLVESSSRSDLSFGPTMDKVDKVIKILSFSQTD